MNLVGIRLWLVPCLLVVVLGAACSAPGGNSARGLCEDVACSGHGACVVEHGSPMCDCDSGFEVRGLSCVEARERDDDMLRIRHGVGLATPVEFTSACDGDDCAVGEYLALWPEDAGAVCGDGACTHDEDACSCADDCGATCGDGCCTDEEDACSCADDCGATCGDGCCTHDEDPGTCAADCAGSCGDGIVSDGEACDDGERNSDTDPEYLLNHPGLTPS